MPYQDGPYLVRGPAIIRDQNGEEIKLSRRTVALCRCGKSRMRPFCDGTHRLVRFAAPSPPETYGSELDSRPRETPVRSSSDRAAVIARAGSSAARRELGRIKERLGAWLGTDPHLGSVGVAMRSAEPLIASAWLLLGERRSVSRGDDLLDVQAPARHLIRGAREVLASAAGGENQRVSELIAQLEAVLGLLEPGAGLS